MTKSELRKLFISAQNAMGKAIPKLMKFTEAFSEYYGFDYHDLDMDEIIDAIDYGGEGLSFSDLEKIAREAIAEAKN